MATLTRSEIEQVLHIPSSPGFILSCYTDLTVKDSFQRHWSGVLKHTAALIKQQLHHNLAASEEFEANYRSLMAILTNPETQQHSALALFVADQRQVIIQLPLSLPVTTS